MCKTISATALLAILAVAGCAPAQAADRTVQLTCLGHGTVAQALCQAVRDGLVRDGHILSEQGDVQLRLHADLASPQRLLARLEVTGDGPHRSGEQGELSVIDRDTIPHQQLEDFAAALIDRAGLGS